MHIIEEEAMRKRIKKGEWNPEEWSKRYFEMDAVEKEYMQHVVFERLQAMRHKYLVIHEMELSLSDVLCEQLHKFEKLEDYGMCQILKDAADLYEIDLY